MARRRHLIQLVLAALIALVGLSISAPIGAKERDDDGVALSKTERSSTLIPVSWEMTPERCGRLNATTRGTGKMRENVTIRRYIDGTIDVVVSDVVSGKASDANGVSYHWAYQNFQHATIPAAPNNDRVYIQMTDLFTLNDGGKHGSAPFTIGLTWRWDYTNAGDMPPFTGQWPPERNLVKLATVGDFTVIPTGLDCDPV